MSTLPYTFAVTLVLLTTAFLRLLYILPALHRTTPHPRKRGTPTHLLIVLGSGGHTAEMLSLLTDLDPKSYTHRSYVISSGDSFSAIKAREFEKCLASKTNMSEAHGRPSSRDTKPADIEEFTMSEGKWGKGYTIHNLPRARLIHQSLLTTPVSSLRCLLASLYLLLTHPLGSPDLILANGPATSLILILAATVLRFFAFLPLLPTGAGKRRGAMRIIYVESWARVRKPSLSGRLVAGLKLADRVLVQWNGLERDGWGEFRGCLVR